MRTDDKRDFSFNYLLRTVPNNIQSIFVQFMNMQEMQILARAIEIRKENWG